MNSTTEMMTTSSVVTALSYSIAYAFAIAIVAIVNLNLVAWMGFVALRRYWKGGVRQTLWSYCCHVIVWDSIRWLVHLV